MNSYLVLFGILVIGYIGYFFLRDHLFGQIETFQPLISTPAPVPTSIEIRHAPLYPPRTVAASGPSAPSQEPPTEEIVYGDPIPTDPYHVAQESSDHPENLRHPERAYRAPPLNQSSGLSVSSGVAAARSAPSLDHSQVYQNEMIQGGGEFMPGIFANDTLNDATFSAF
jgi:hypothetical protein